MLNSHDSSDDDNDNDNNDNNDNDNNDNDNNDDDDDDIYNVDAVKGSYMSKKPSVHDTSDIEDEEEEEQDAEVVGSKRVARESVTAPQIQNKKRAAPKPPVHSDSEEEDDDDKEGDQKENAPSSSAAPPTAFQQTAPTNTALSDHEEDDEGFGSAEKGCEQDEPSLVAASFSLKQNNAQKSVLGTSMQISMPSSSSTKDAAAQGHESGGDDDDEEEGQDVCKKSKKKPVKKAQKGQSEDQRGNNNDNITTVKKRGRGRGQHSETVVGCGVESATVDTHFMNNMTIAVKVPGKTRDVHLCNFMSFVEKSQWTVTRAEFALPEGSTKHFAPWAVGASEEGVLGIPAVPFPFEDFIAKEKIDQQPILCNDDLDFIRHCAAATISCQRPASSKEKATIVLFLRVKLIQPSEDAAHYVLDAWHTFCLRQAGLVGNSAAKKECEVLLQLSKESFHHITNKPSVVTSFFTKDVFSLGTSNVSYIQQNRQNTLFDDNEFDPPFQFKLKRQTSDAVSSSKRPPKASAAAAAVNQQTITSMAQGAKSSSKETAAPPPPLETSQQQPSSSSSTYAQAHATCDSDGDEFGSGNYNETATSHKKPATSFDEQLSDESNETTTLVSTGRVESHLAIDFPGLPDLIKESEKKIAFHDAQIKLHQENKAYNVKVLNVLTQCT